MANETVVEQMVVRLLGDGSSFQKMMTQASTSAEMTAKQVEAAGSRIEAISNNLTTFATKAVGALGLFGLASSFKGMFDSAVQFEDTMLRLKGAVEANGRVAGPAIERYKEFAKEMRNTTTATKNAVYSMLQHAEAQGLEGKAAEKAVRDSVALAAARGGEASGYLRIAVAMQKGETFMLRRLLHMHHVTDQSLLMAKAQEVLNAGYKIEAERTQSVSARLDRLGETFKELSKDIGKSLMESVKPLITALESTASWFNKINPSVRSFITVVVGLTVAMVPLKMLFGGVTSYVTATITAFMAARTAIVAYLAQLTLIQAAQMLVVASTTILGVALAAVIVIGIAKAVGMIDAYKRMNEEIEEGVRLQKLLLDLRSKKTADVLEKAAKAVTPEERGEILTAEMEKQKKAVAQYEEQIEKLKKRREELKKSGGPSFWESFWPANVHEWLGDMKSLELEEKQAKELKDSSTESAKKLADELKKMALNPEVISKLEKLKEHLQEGLSTSGLSGTDAKIKKLQEEARKALEAAMGSGDKEAVTAAKVAEAKVREVKALALIAQAQKEIVEPIQKANKHLYEQIAVFGMTAREAERYKLALKGATSGQLLGMAQKHWALDVLDTMKKLTAEGLKMTEEFKDPIEKLDEQKQHLSDLYRTGAIGAETYAKGLRKAEKAAEGTAIQLDKAVSIASVEYLERMDKYFEGAREIGKFELPADRAATDMDRARIVAEINDRDRLKKTTQEINTTNLRQLLIELFPKPTNTAVPITVSAAGLSL